MQVTSGGEVWWSPRDPSQAALWGSWIELGEKFFKAILAAPVPLDMRALKALKRSPLALDLYAWLTYEAYRAHKSGKGRFVAWKLLAEQIGTDTPRVTNFQQKAVATLRKYLGALPRPEARTTARRHSYRAGEPAGDHPTGHDRRRACLPRRRPKSVLRFRRPRRQPLNESDFPSGIARRRATGRAAPTRPHLTQLPPWVRELVAAYLDGLAANEYYGRVGFGWDDIGSTDPDDIKALLRHASDSLRSTQD